MRGGGGLREPKPRSPTKPEVSTLRLPRLLLADETVSDRSRPV